MPGAVDPSPRRCSIGTAPAHRSTSSHLARPPAPTDTSPLVTATPDPGFHVERVDLQDGRSELRFGGELRFRQCFASWQNVRRLAQSPAAHLAFDLSAVE